MLAIFDLNDTLIGSRRPDGWVLRAEDWFLLPGAGEALRRIREAGWALAVATNQPGAVRFADECPEPRLRAVLAQVQRALVCAAQAPVPFYVCLHDKGDGCDCRKPGAGLILRALAEAGVDPARKPAVVVGDKRSDVEAGIAAGCRTVQVGPGAHEADCPADFAVASIAEVPEVLACVLRQWAEGHS